MLKYCYLFREGTESHSLETNVEGITEEVSQELWHSLNLDESIVVDIKVGPGGIEMLIEETFGLLSGITEVVGEDLLGNRGGTILVEEEVARWSTLWGFHFDGVGLNKGLHKLIVGEFSESAWDLSLISSLGTGSAESWNEVLNLLLVILSLELGKLKIILVAIISIRSEIDVAIAIIIGLFLL